MDAAPNIITAVSQIRSTLDTAREQAKGGFNWVKFGQWFVELLHVTVTTLDAVRTLTGREKRDIAVAAVGDLFDIAADRCVPLPLYPAWLAIRGGTRTLVLAMATGAIEAILKISRSAT